VRISPERIGDELRAALTPPSRARAWDMLCRYGVDGVVFRFLKLPAPTHPEIRGARSRIFEGVAPGDRIPLGLALAAATVEYVVGRFSVLAAWEDASVRKAVHAMREALRISNDESAAMEGTLYWVGHLVRNPAPRVAALKRFLARPTASLTRALFSALPADWVPHRANVEQQLAELEKTDFAPPPLVSGDDLTAAGLKPGRDFKRVLDEAYDSQLEGRVTTKQDALELALRIARG
jgi:hypothetical protein